MFNQNRNDDIVVRPAPTPKLTSLSPEYLAEIERRAKLFVRALSPSRKKPSSPTSSVAAN